MTRRADALKSLYAGKAASKRVQHVLEVLARYGCTEPPPGLVEELAASKALAGNVGGQAREQTVFTPEWLIAQLRAVEGVIGLDPCTTPANPVQAVVCCTGAGPEDDGKVAPWHLAASVGPFYVNPPYAELRAWLTKARDEHAAGARGWLLGPFRPQRGWFLPLLAGLDVALLRPFAFVGHDSAFPAPLFLAGYGVRIPELVDERGRALITGHL